MPKEIAIVTFKKEAALLYSKQIKSFFKEHIKITIYAFEDGEISFIKENLVLLSTYLRYEEVKNHTFKDAQIIIPRITLTQSSIEKIKKIPKGTSALLYNLSSDMAIETISMIYQLGINHINLIPCYPQMTNLPPVDLAITPGEKDSIESKVKNVIDIGYRVLDISTLLDIAVKLELDHLIHANSLKKHFNNIITNSFGIEKLLGETDKIENQFDLLMKVLDDGIICTNLSGTIYFYSEIAKKIIGLESDAIIGRNIEEFISSVDFKFYFSKKLSLDQKLICLNQKDISIEMKYLKINNFEGFVIKLKTFNYLEQKQTKLRAQLLKKGNISKYNFDDIVGSSKEIQYIKKIAIRMAKSNSSILITGETGTGKELFAQAIHNSSYRENGPFVAVNCGAFQESLLQSELFGYEEGAFTGAKKGGKIGLFELAHNGTLFLDEIGEIDLSLQSQLLRVIQEKQIRRIGSDRVLDVDVRIIAATNRNLKSLVKEEKFRQDLYFRLNVLPLNIKPLRERKEDILLIFDFIRKKLKSNFKLSSEVECIFNSYPWSGNVRELNNIVEYLANLSEPLILKTHLPEYMKEDFSSECSSPKISEEKPLTRNEIHYIFVLKNLKIAYNNKKRIGRRKLSQIAKEQELFLSEQEIRNILIDLEKKRFVDILIGRAGSVITKKGLEYLKQFNF